MPANLPLIYGLPSLLDRLMDQEDNAPLPAPQEFSFRHFPPVQVFEDDEAVHVRASLPGVCLESVDLVYERGSLILRGLLPVPEGVHLRRERASGPFRREVRIPSAVCPASISAVMRNGVLSVTLPKDPGAKKRVIPVVCLQGTQS